MDTCQICDNKNRIKNRIIKVNENMNGTAESFNYLLCVDCGTLQLAENIKDISLYYQNYYSFKEQKESCISKYLKRKRDKYILFGKNRILGKVLDKIYPLSTVRLLELIPNLQLNSKIIDVGCGSGNFLRNLERLGFSNLYGIDPFLESNIKISNRLSLDKKDIYDIVEKYDIVVLNHVFEHLDNPTNILRHLKSILNPNGFIIIAIPLADSFAFANYRENWIQIDAPRHFFLYTKKSLNILAAQNELEVVYVGYNSFYFQFLASEQAERGIPMFSKNSYLIKNNISKISTVRFQKLSNLLNKQQKGDQAYFIIKSI